MAEDTKPKAPRKKAPKTIAAQIGKQVVSLNKLLGEAKEAGMSVVLAPNDPSGNCMSGLAIIHMTVNDDLMSGVDESVKGDGSQVAFGTPIARTATPEHTPGQNRFLAGTGIETPQDDANPDRASAQAAAAATIGGQQQGADLDFRRTADKAEGPDGEGQGQQQWTPQKPGGVEPSTPITPGQGQFPGMGDPNDEGNIPT